MANVKISELTALTPPDAADLVPVTDSSASQTKRTTVGEIVGIVNGDVDVANDGTATISELPVSKLQDGDARQLLQTDAAGNGVEWTSNVDVPGTLDVTGATTLDSTLSVPLGSDGAPSLTFTSDPDTGLYSPGANQVALSTNGTGRLFVDATGKVTVNQATDGVPSINIESDNDGRIRTILRFTDTDVATAANQPLGVIQFFGSDTSGAGAGIKSTIGAYSESTNGDSYLTFSTATSALNNQERLRITSAGLVGIGTSSVATVLGGKALEIEDSSGSELILSNSTQGLAGNEFIGGVVFQNNDTSGSPPHYAGIWAKANDAFGYSNLYLAAGRDSYETDAPHLTIDHLGNVGIGTSSPGANLELGPVSATEGPTLRLSAGAGGGQGIPEYPFGTIEFFSNDLNGDGEEVKASIAAVANTNSTAPGGQITFSTKPISGSTVLTERLRIDSSGRVGIGTTTPQSALSFASGSHIGVATTDTVDNGVLTIGGAGAALNNRGGYIELYGNENASLGNVEIAAGKGGASGATAGSIILRTGAGTANERARIDSSGKLLVGTSSAFDNFSNLQVADATGLGINLSHFTNTPSGGSLAFYKSRGSTVGTNALVSADDRLGRLSFYGADGTNYIQGASIAAFVDGTPGANDMPGRLVFSTTADGASSPTEQLRITSNRYVRLASGTGGIQFNGDTAAANALDDYEEGTFTPTITNVTVGDGTLTGKYVKVGNLVWVQVYFVWGSTTTSSGEWTVNAFPFATTIENAHGSAALTDAGTGSYAVAASYAALSFTGFKISDGTGIGFVSNTSPFTWTTNDRFMFSATYAVN